MRAHKIFEKLAAQQLAGSAEDDARAAASATVSDDLWELVLGCARTAEMVEKAVVSLEFSLLAGHTRELAQSFHKLYHEHPVLHAEDEATRALLAELPQLRRQMLVDLNPLLRGADPGGSHGHRHHAGDVRVDLREKLLVDVGELEGDLAPLADLLALVTIPSVLLQRRGRPLAALS